MKTIVIHLEGGLVQGIYSDGQIDAKVIVVDYDIDGGDINPEIDGVEVAVHGETIDLAPEYVELAKQAMDAE